MKETNHFSLDTNPCHTVENLLKEKSVESTLQFSEPEVLKLMLKLEENQMKMIELKKELKLAKYETSVAIKRYELLQGKMFANIGDVIVIIAKDGITKYKSPNLEKWFGWKPEEVVGKSIWENIYPDDLEHVKNFIGTLKEKYDAAGKIEFRYQCKNGRYKWIEFTAVNLLYDPDILGILGNYHDITERIQAEKQFRLLSRAIEQSPVTIVITDKEGNIEYANPKYEDGHVRSFAFHLIVRPVE